MCGIVGIVHRSPECAVETATLTRIRDLLHHRGPDEAGLHVDGNAGLAHTRLSIIDLASGRQPMFNDDASLCIVFNGEIYNYRELRKELSAKGHAFRTKSDTEVILRLFEEEGGDCVRRLNGIFAFAIWDSRRRRLFLARDHLGVKPLYYASTPDAFVFSSEIKSIVHSGYMAPQCRDDGVFEYFVFRQVSGDRTLYDGIRSLPPACMLQLEDGEAQVHRYWAPRSDAAQRPRSFSEAAEELDVLIGDAVRMQLVSDVPLGTFCSGGIDSSLVTALAARASSGPINTFSVGFHEQAYDETSFAKQVSAQYGTQHHELRIDGAEFAELLPSMIWHHDSPLNFANSIQIFAISRLAKRYVTVVLTGEGADEIFGGYPRYMVPGLSERYRKLPSAVKDLVDRLGPSIGRRIHKVHRNARRPLAESLLYNSAVLEPEFACEILVRAGGGLSFREKCLGETDDLAGDTLARALLLDQQNYLVSILERQDKMSMAASIESRVPFLDHRVVEFANGLPSTFKLRGFETKAILKRVARKYLPRDVVDRRKSGFGVPLREWFADVRGLGRFLDDARESPDLAPFTRKEVVARLVEQHRSGEADHSEALWTIVNFMLWLRGLEGQRP